MDVGRLIAKSRGVELVSEGERAVMILTFSVRPSLYCLDSPNRPRSHGHRFYA
jgi:hypothetical protein